MTFKYAISLFILCPLLSLGQESERKTLEALRIDQDIKVDGVMDEGPWQTASVASDFIQNNPKVGVPANQISQVRILYDDDAIYIGAELLDNAPDSILTQLTQRDDEGNCDLFSAQFNCYKDGLNGLDFAVTAAGVQIDTKVTDPFQDRGWNAVWWSAVKINDKGWTVEMKIPYAALRFPDTETQEWYVNFSRNVRRTRENSFWSEVDPEINGRYVQSGLLKGIKDIQPPMRLFFYPFVSAYLENDQSQGSDWQTVLNGGMDVKYGLSDAYTLDMTLIPDFGQVQSDNQVLNLSPFEVFFDENRQFFTEGTELFDKGDLFYSRRIGGRPNKFFDVYDFGDHIEVLSNPSTSRLLNATKVSGRGKEGLGIGLLNATTDRMTALLKNTETAEEFEFETDPLTNYNILVLDQNLWENSYAALINTNVTRNGSSYDANVTGMDIRLMNKKRTGSFSSSAALSQKYYRDSTNLGHTFSIGYRKSAGKWNYGFDHYHESDTYDPNDFGFLFSNNESAYSGFIGHRQLEPNKTFNRSNVFLNVNYSRLYRPDEFQNFNVNSNFFFLTKSFQAFGGFWSIEPIETFDYFEPRSPGRFYRFPENYNLGTWVSTDYRKRFAIDARWNYRWFMEPNRQRFNFGIEPRFRYNDKLMFILEYGKFNFNSDIGWVNSLEDGEIILGRRDQDIHEVIFRSNYVFNNTMGLTFRLRHYWTKVHYLEYYEMDQEGRLLPTSYDGSAIGENGHDTNFNAFNIDMVYRWVFSPGSEMSVVWKNSILDSETDINRGYFENLERTISLDQVNSISIKVLYFLDYRTVFK